MWNKKCFQIKLDKEILVIAKEIGINFWRDVARCSSPPNMLSKMRFLSTCVVIIVVVVVAAAIHHFSRVENIFLTKLNVYIWFHFIRPARLCSNFGGQLHFHLDFSSQFQQIFTSKFCAEFLSPKKYKTKL